MAEREAGQVLATRPEPAEKIDLMRTREIRDIKVQNPDGEKLGDLTDIAIDRDNGCITYAVLAYGGILGFGEKHFAIPWEGIRIRSREKIAVVDTDKEILDKSHGFSRDQMPMEGDWSLIRTPPSHVMGREGPPPLAEESTAQEVKPAAKEERTVTREGESAQGETKTAARTENVSPGTGESYTPVPPAVQTVAGGWGGVPTRPRTEEQPARTEAQTTGAVVEEIRREPPAQKETVAEEQPETRRAEPSHAHISAADLQVYLRGIDYPVGKQDLIAHAQKNNAPEGVIGVIEQFSDRTYRSAAEVSQEFGKVR